MCIAAYMIWVTRRMIYERCLEVEEGKERQVEHQMDGSWL